jgi:pyruvate kinase
VFPGILSKPIKVTKGKCFTLTYEQTNFGDFHEYIKPEDVVWASDSTLKFVVKESGKKEITFFSESNGLLENNKGLHVRGIHKDIPFLFQKDLDLLRLASTLRVDFVSLSFVRNKEDIISAKELTGHDIKIIAKIETRSAVDNIQEIFEEVEYINIDRGDLSTEIGLVKVAAYQKYIVEKALFYNKKVFLATQFLKNMISNPVPSISEVVDLYNTFKLGVFGIQLSEETAIGQYPAECLDIISRVIDEIESEVM